MEKTLKEYMTEWAREVQYINDIFVNEGQSAWIDYIKNFILLSINYKKERK